MRRAIKKSILAMVTAGMLTAVAGGAMASQDMIAASGSAVSGSPKVLVIPFSAINVPEGQHWIAKGVQETLVADFGRSKAYTPIAFGGQVIVEDNATAARLARTASAQLAVRGAAQLVNGNVRLTAQLIDAKSGDTLSTASVTGTANDLLKLEDELSAQLRGVSTPVAPAAPAVPTPVAAGAQTAPIVIQQPAQPQVIVISQPQTSYPDYSAYNDYGYGGYPYGYGYPVGWYPGFYPGVVFTVISPGRHDHDHHFPGHGPGVHTGPMGDGSLPLPTGVGLPLPSGAGLPLPGHLPFPIQQAAPVAGGARFISMHTMRPATLR